MPQKRSGFTTVLDLEEFNRTSWTFLTNIKMSWQYDGMAYLFRKEGIALYGIDRGTMKMNHPIMFMAIPQHRDKNYGVDIYVPVNQEKKARKIIADQDRVRECASLEATEGKEAREAFNQAALSLMGHNKAAIRARARERRASLLPFGKQR